MYTIGPERMVLYTIEASNSAKKKESFYSGGVYFFFPVLHSETVTWCTCGFGVLRLE